MKRVIINFKKVTDRESFYDLIEQKLGTPDYFGRNLDALHDVLTEKNITLEVRSFSHLCEVLGDYAEAFAGMLRATDEECDRLRVVIKE